jgi:ferredoxin-NADP reductase/MOSC domain-containing protein YiiM/ferredoxin
VEKVVEMTLDENPAGVRAGTVLAVNVGLPRNVSWRGRTVYTGVWKRPVDGPRMVRRLNIDGDGQGDLAGHGGEQRAVLVYQLDSYRYWQEQLGRSFRKDGDFKYGQFGENLTVEGLPDDQVCVGDRYRIGGALFEVSQPRVTCYRVGIRLDDPRVPALLVSHHRPGFYLRVIEEGPIQAGDEIVKVATGPEAMSIAEIDALLYLPGHPRHQVARALRIPALSPGWQASFRAILDQADAGAGNAGLTEASPPPAWAGFRPLVMTRIDEESRTIRSLWLADPDGTPVPAALPGQFLTLRLRPDSAGPPVVRSYSLSGRPGGNAYRVSVKRESHGAASGYLHTRVQVGDTIEVAAPRGTFTLRTGTGPVLLISAGVGATPVMAMLEELAAERSDREIWWLYGARDRAEHPFAAESARLLTELPHARRYVCYSRPGDFGGDFDATGRLSADALAALNPPRDAEAYLCGPAGFLRDMSAALVAMGFAPAAVRTEIFGSQPALTPGIAAGPTSRPPHPPAGPAGDGPAVAFARSGLTVPWQRDFASLLDFAEACDVPTRWSCRTGVCHNCETGLLSGEVEYAPEPVDPPADGDALICCSRPRGAVVLDL